MGKPGCFFLSLAITLLLGACVSPAVVTAPAPVRGKVSLDGVGLAGVVVSAWPAAVPALEGAAPFISAPSTATGLFSLEVPPGEYYFLAAGKTGYAYYGRNPVSVEYGGIAELKIGLVARPVADPIVVTGPESGVSGTVVVHGEPREGAVVFAYTDLTSRLKGMGYAMSAPSDAEGRFRLELPAGTYYLLARLRREGGRMNGPLRAGDFIGYAEENPVRVGENRMQHLTIPLLEVPEKVEQLASTLFGATAIKGRIVTRDGKPVAGARAILYNEPQMLNRPLYVSQPSDTEGRFVLSFPHGGTYYLAARQQLGGAPAPGELYGTYDTSPDHALSIETGAQRDDIELVVEEMW